MAVELPDKIILIGGGQPLDLDKVDVGVATANALVRIDGTAEYLEELALLRYDGNDLRLDHATLPSFVFGETGGGIKLSLYYDIAADDAYAVSAGDLILEANAGNANILAYGTLSPYSSTVQDLGSSSAYWRHLYLSGSIRAKIGATERTVTIQDEDQTLAGRATTDTFTNKTIDARGGTANTVQLNVADLTDLDTTGLADEYIIVYDAIAGDWYVRAESGGGSYLPLSGGAMTGDIDLDGNDLLAIGKLDVESATTNALIEMTLDADCVGGAATTGHGLKLVLQSDQQDAAWIAAERLGTVSGWTTPRKLTLGFYNNVGGSQQEITGLSLDPSGYSAAGAFVFNTQSLPNVIPSTDGVGNLGNSGAAWAQVWGVDGYMEDSLACSGDFSVYAGQSGHTHDAHSASSFANYAHRVATSAKGTSINSAPSSEEHFASVYTSDATVTNLFSWTTAASYGWNQVEIEILARRTNTPSGNDQWGTAVFKGSFFYRELGTFAGYAQWNQHYSYSVGTGSFGAFPWTVAVNTSVATVRVQVTGASGENIAWWGKIRTFRSNGIN